MVNHHDLAAWRKRLTLTQTQMACFVGVPFKTWVNWERRYRTVPPVAESLFEILLMAEVTGWPGYGDRLNNAKGDTNADITQ